MAIDKQQADDQLQIIVARNQYYRDGYRYLLSAILFAFAIIVGLVTVMIYQLTHPPAPVYFAVTTDGKIQQLVPLDKPNISQYALLQWAATAAIAAYNYNYVDYRQQLQAASEFFTPEGWGSFLSQLEQSNNLNAVKAKKMIVAAVATGAPVILQEGIVNGRYIWKVQIPLLVTYLSASEQSKQNLVVTMVIERVSTLNSARGIGLKSFIAVEEGTAFGR